MNRCLGCFNEMEAAQNICSVCHFEERKYKGNTQALPLRTIVNHHYLIGQVLGQGGFGITYAAWDMNNHFRVALKEYFPIDIVKRTTSVNVDLIDPSNQEIFDYGMERFIDEANALVRFNRHPGVVNIYDLFQSNQTAYMVMQYLEGKTWLEMAETKGGRLSVEEALPTLLLACDALRAVHDVGMLHRDISPDNILILPNNQVKLIDFGAARYAMKQEQQVFSILFKPGYTPEEQYRTKGLIGPWSDIYALGATFYRIITGKVPLDAMNRQERDTIAPPSKMRIPLSSTLERALMKSLSIKASDRYQKMEDFKKALTMKEELVLPSHPFEKRPNVFNMFWVIGLFLGISIFFLILLLID